MSCCAGQEGNRWCGMLFPMEEPVGTDIENVPYVRFEVRAFVVMSALLCVGVVTYGVYTLADRFVGSDVVVGGSVPDITVWVGDQKLGAQVLRLDRVSGTKPENPAVGGTFFVVLPVSGVPRITFLNHPVDLWWLNAVYATVGAEYGMVPDRDTPLMVPEGAMFLLIAPTGVLPPDAGITAHTVRVPDAHMLR